MVKRLITTLEKVKLLKKLLEEHPYFIFWYYSHPTSFYCSMMMPSQWETFEQFCLDNNIQYIEMTTEEFDNYHPSLTGDKEYFFFGHPAAATWKNKNLTQRFTPKKP